MDSRKLNIAQKVLAYLGDKLSNKDRHVFEQEFSQDPFMQDAMDGLMELSAEELEQDMLLLNQKVQNRTKQKKDRILVPYLKIAASILILLGIGSIIIFLNNNKLYDSKLAEQTLNEQVKEKTAKVKELQKIIEEEIAEQEKDENYEIQKTETIKKAKIEQKYLKENIVQKPIKKTVVSRSEIKSTTEDNVDEKEFNSKRRAIADETIDKNSPIILTYSDTIATNNKQVTAENMSYAAGVTISEMKSSSPAIVYTQKKKENKLSGIIVDELGEPLPGANIYISGTTKGAVTDMNGYFSIDGDLNNLLKINFIGYKETEISANELQAQNNTIGLEPDLLALEEVVVVGYGTQKKNDITGAVVHIDANDISPHNAPDNNYVAPPKTFKPRKIQLTYKSNADTIATPIGGVNKLERYFKKNFKYESNSKTEIVLTFHLKANGSLSDITIIDSPNDDYSNEAIQLLNNGPTWEPSILNGKKLKEQVTMTIIFK